MKDRPDPREKVRELIAPLAGERAAELLEYPPKNEYFSRVEAALRRKHGPEVARDIAFHLADWNSDGAFLTALLLFPEKFTQQEIREGIEAFLIHASNHIAAAAKLLGYPVQDIFGVGALDSES